MTYTESEAAHEQRIQDRIAREPVGSHRRDVALLKQGIYEFHQTQQTKLLIDYVRLLLAAEKSRAVENRRCNQTVERPEMARAIGVWFEAYLSIVAGNKCGTFFLERFCRKLALRFSGDHPFHGAWRDLVPLDAYWVEVADLRHREAVANYNPKQVVVGENDFYVAPDAHDRPAYERLLVEQSGRFRELLSLCRLHVDHWNAVRDPVTLSAFSKLVSAIHKQQANMALAEADLVAPPDMDATGRLLAELFARDIPPSPAGWREQLAAMLRREIDDAEFVEDTFLRLLEFTTERFDGWHSDCLKLVESFPTIIRATLSEGIGRDDVLERFVCAGAATLYPMPIPEGLR